MQVRATVEYSRTTLAVITALAADSPEISAAVVSMISGQQEVAVEVVFGSNLLASLLGVTALIAGKACCRAQPCCRMAV